MEKFFLHLLNKIEILTGIRQLERLQDKPEQLQELIQECSKAANQFPLKEEITKSVLIDAVSSDQDFIGLNVKWVRKVLNLYCQVHGVNKSNEKEEVIDLVARYDGLAQFWKSRLDLDPDGLRGKHALMNVELVRGGKPPVDDLEGIKILAGIYAKQIEGTILAQSEPKGSGSKMRDTLPELPPEEIERRERKKAYRLANYDLETGNALETWLPEDEWIRKNFEQPNEDNNINQK